MYHVQEPACFQKSDELFIIYVADRDVYDGSILPI